MTHAEEIMHLAESMAKKDEEIERLKERVAELEKFVTACRYAGPGVVEQLRKEAQDLISKKLKN